MRTTRALALSLSLLPACGGGGPALSRQSLDPASQQALLVADDARQQAIATADVAGLLGQLGPEATAGLPGLDGLDGLGALGSLGAQGGIGGLGAGCALDSQLSAGQVTLSGSCALPSGGHLAGKISVGFASGCAAGAIHVALDVDLERDGERAHVVGTVDVTPAANRLSVAADLDKTLSRDGHAISSKIAACVIVDAAAAIVAVDGSIRRSIDGVHTRTVRVEDLQVAACQSLPISGEVDVVREGVQTHVSFAPTHSGDDAATHVEIDRAGTQLSADVINEARCADAPRRLELDYAACGACAAPSPLPAGNVGSADAPADPIQVL
jgi:hypothetical protein